MRISARNTWAAALATLLLPGMHVTSSAAELEWYQEALIVNNPNELGYYLHVSDDCPDDLASVESIVEGVMIRSRVAPIAEHYSEDEQLFIEINVYCTAMQESSDVIFETDVRFGFLARNTDMVLNWDYGSLDQGQTSDIKAVLRRDVEDALTDYLRANLPINNPLPIDQLEPDSSAAETRL